MLHTHIAVVLPLGLTRPVYARLEGTRQRGHWVRAGDLHHGPTGITLFPPWDGAAFETIWSAAAGRSQLGAPGPEVVFAVHHGARLVPVGRVTLDRSLQRQVRFGD
ncbi:MAG: hypothetical protein CL927_08095 [Deltaproteobacteria bacterium]|nr:hypothetical protein [Deltaproteobacteria bacterium]HCH61673.1 hypothetical protein [Deltaproteobacteria bacterium]